MLASGTRVAPRVTRTTVLTLAAILHLPTVNDITRLVFPVLAHQLAELRQDTELVRVAFAAAGLLGAIVRACIRV